MTILKLLNKKNLLTILIIFILFLAKVEANDPVDIWSIETDKVTIEENQNQKEIVINEEKIINSNYEINTQKNINQEIEQDETLLSQNLKIVGIYDPAVNGLMLDMWSNSNGDQIFNILNRIKDTKLSNDAKEILNIALLTNSYPPQKNISTEQFLAIKSDWLIKNKNIQLIEKFLIKNQDIKENLKLVKFLVDDYLSESKLEEACDVFSKIDQVINDDYLSKFNIYCLINLDKREEAQLLYDLKKEFDFKDDFYEKKFNYLMGYDKKENNEISDKTILEFHLSHRTNLNFKFIPKLNTPKKIWRYLAANNLLENAENIDLEDQKKISIIEKATHERNYPEKKLYDLYKRFQFNINQLLSVKESYKLLSNVEAKALVYQGILITDKVESKLKLIKILKNLFIKENIPNAFKDELENFLQEINLDDVPAEYTTFYNNTLNKNDEQSVRIKINNKIIHQSKLINYFREKTSKENTEKELNDILKKKKKSKKYFFSTKDIILIESLKSDGISISKKYKNLYKVDEPDMPIDIQIMINNNEKGLVLLRLVQIIGQDELKDIGTETIYFIINALNQLNIDPIRNKILLKILPLKV
jgi:hypothetical protein